jgi:predicted AlkP superfamily pyrophosphatase or phosphodiesterase
MFPIFPDWSNSILNISATFQKYLGTDNAFKKIEVLQEELEKDYKNILYIVIDGMGEKVLQKQLSKNSFLRQNIKQVVTSTFPSTTSTATTSILTANFPAVHGWLGWAMNFGDRTVELFKNCDYYTGEAIGYDFSGQQLPYKRFFDKPQKKITTYALMPDIANCKTRAQENFTHKNIRDMMKKLDRICKQDGKKFVYCYNYDLDNTMHMNGVKSFKAKSIIRSFNKKIEKLILNNPSTLAVITADHGHIDIKGRVDIYKDEEIISCLASNLSLEPRATVFNIKQGFEDKFRQAFKKYAADFELFETKELIDRGVFGTFKGDKYKQFLGNFIAVGKDTAKMFIFAENKGRKNGKILRGHHTGATETEMYVPLIIVSSAN